MALANCATCGLTFTSVGGFDFHRHKGVCRTPDELRAKGYEPNDRGQWRKPMPEGQTPWDTP